MKLLNRYTMGPLALLSSWVLRGWMNTLDCRFIAEDPRSLPDNLGQNGIYLTWHENLLFPTTAYTRNKVAALISNHRDGELIARVLKMMGTPSVRGSTNRKGTTGLRNLMRRGKVMHVAITPDGPRGPRRVVKLGAVYLASRNGMPIIPVGCAFTKAKRAGSWDHMALPIPGAKGYCVIGPPISVPADVSMDDLESHRQTVQAAMDRVQQRAESLAENRRLLTANPAHLRISML